MPEKDPATLATLLHALWSSVPEHVKAAILSSVIAILRIMYDDQEPSMFRRLLESALCGSIAFGVAAGIEALGGPAGLATFCGGAVGLFGADQVRAWGKAFASRRIEAIGSSPKR